MNALSSNSAATADLRDQALSPTAAEASVASPPADLPPAESEQDSLTGGCLTCGIRFNHNQTLAEPIDDAPEAPEPQPAAPNDLPPAESEQDSLMGGCSGISCGGIKFNHNQTLAEPTDAGRDH